MLNRHFVGNLISTFILDSSQNQHSLSSLNRVSSTVHSVHHGVLQENNSVLPGNIINKFANKAGGGGLQWSGSLFPIHLSHC